MIFRFNLIATGCVPGGRVWCLVRLVPVYDRLLAHTVFASASARLLVWHYMRICRVLHAHQNGHMICGATVTGANMHAAVCMSWQQTSLTQQSCKGA
jgi:hypothetical protein